MNENFPKIIIPTLMNYTEAHPPVEIEAATH